MPNIRGKFGDVDPGRHEAAGRHVADGEEEARIRLGDVAEDPGVAEKR